MVNPVLARITNTPFELVEFCQKNNILVQAYSPIGHGKLLKNNDVLSIAKKYKVSVAQLGIRYCLELGMQPLPKTNSINHMEDNTKVDFAISPEDMTFLKNLDTIDDYGEYSYFPVFNL